MHQLGYFEVNSNDWDFEVNSNDWDLGDRAAVGFGGGGSRRRDGCFRSPHPETEVGAGLTLFGPQNKTRGSQRGETAGNGLSGGKLTPLGSAHGMCPSCR